MSITDTAHAFFDACETGKGWDVCAAYCTGDASFACQAGALADVVTLEAYTEWMKGLLTPIPDGHYDLKGFATDEARGVVLAYAQFIGTHSADGGPMPPTNQSTTSDYVYAMVFSDGKIKHMTKVWNDGHALAELGWA